MNQFWWMQLEFFLRLLLAAILGGIIGYERKSRGKGAGLRTHIIVAVASALMMIISKYGFSDFQMMAFGGAETRFDPTRIASQIVSGVGFLGAGTIFFSRKTVYGLTTAAGIWATSGVGMAIGAGMYLFGVIGGILIVLSQIVLHLDIKLLKMPREEHITMVIDDTDEAVAQLKELLKKNKIHAEQMSMKRIEGSLLEVELDTIVPFALSPFEVLRVSQETPYIKSIKI